MRGLFRGEPRAFYKSAHFINLRVFVSSFPCSAGGNLPIVYGAEGSLVTNNY